MSDAKTWIEIFIFLAGWIGTIAAIKQNQKNLGDRLDRSDKDFGDRLDKMGGKLDVHVGVLNETNNRVTLHTEQINVLKKMTDEHASTAEIQMDEMRGDLVRHGRKINKVEKWQAVADSTLRRLEPGWSPPINGD